MKKSHIQETLNLLAYADNRTDAKKTTPKVIFQVMDVGRPVLLKL